jgi:hypothetical protein
MFRTYEQPVKVLTEAPINRAVIKFRFIKFSFFLLLFVKDIKTKSQYILHKHLQELFLKKMYFDVTFTNITLIEHGYD